MGHDVQYKSAGAVLTYDIDSYNIAMVTRVVVGEKYSGWTIHIVVSKWLSTETGKNSLLM